jgi:hypothetical protein
VTYFEAIMFVLRRSQVPLTTNELCDRVLESGLVQPKGKTPKASISAVLYRHAGGDSGLIRLNLVRLDDAGRWTRGLRGSVAWAVGKEDPGTSNWTDTSRLKANPTT